MSIRVNSDAVRNKIIELKKAEENLSSDSLVKTLVFGVSCPEKKSDGNAVAAITALNMELDEVAKKLAELITATNLYLDKVVENFELTDSFLRR